MPAPELIEVRQVEGGGYQLHYDHQPMVYVDFHDYAIVRRRGIVTGAIGGVLVTAFVGWLFYPHTTPQRVTSAAPHASLVLFQTK